MFSTDSVFSINETSCLSEACLVFALTWVVATLIARETTITSPSCPSAGAGGPPLGPRWWKSCDTTNCKNRHTSVLLHHNSTQTDIPIPATCWAPITPPSSLQVFFGTKLGEQAISKTQPLPQFYLLNTWHTNQVNVQLKRTSYSKSKPTCIWILYGTVSYILYILLFWSAVHFFTDYDKAGTRIHSEDIQELWRAFTGLR
jgi:hypothetical protein